MNLSPLRRKRVIIPAVATVAVLAVGGTVWTSTAADDVDGEERDRVAAAATEAAGGGTAVDVETSDDQGEAYEVEVRLEDGSEVDVTLDDDLQVVTRETEDVDDTDDDEDGDRDDDDDADDRRLGDTERASAEEAALAAVGGGTVTDVEASDDRGVAYDVEVRADDGAEWDVDLDADFGVVRKTLDD
ncbi:PepSY domain-containing protein [Nocardioides sp. TF02-7]|uniref:PepSY domain-containing protein n=1 Tax=Nocardioides sp. TF02-7 TaxID=2917724 RepID=UPI001F0578FF|nr:PepSY domain-containing protein [Nocardioides sp. TF02-7]UMG94412.1 PepSY domain-containing protein [Nocardioides sp. TF02-7]